MGSSVQHLLAFGTMRSYALWGIVRKHVEQPLPCHLLCVCTVAVWRLSKTVSAYKHLHLLVCRLCRYTGI